MTRPGTITTEQASAVVKSRLTGGPLDAADCEQEAIRVPGAVQPHGALLAFSADVAEYRVEIVSANIARFLGRDPVSVLGQPVTNVLPETLIASIIAASRAGELSAANPSCFATNMPLARPSDCWVHARGGFVFVELEDATPPQNNLAPASARLVQRTLSAFRDIDTLSALNECLVVAARELTGYERILLYRFDDEWNGTTVAESMIDDWDQPFLGLRFPASDIPAQARELYAENMLRVVPERDATPVPLLRIANREMAGHETDPPVDLSGARLRAQSPVHLEYQRNIGVNGAMSASILKRGELWGLLVGHHRGPHRLAGDVAAAVVTLVNGHAMRLYEVEDEIAREQIQRQQEVYAKLLEQMATHDDYIQALTKGKTRLSDLFAGGGCAIVQGKHVHLIGETPPADIVRKMADAVRGDGTINAIDNLGSSFADFSEYAGMASGVLALPLRDDQGSTILWFRPEVASTVVWAGDPRKSVVREGDTARVLPRRSFERWVEERRGFSEPWRPFQLEAAKSLGFAIDEVILRHARKVAVLSQQLDKVERLTAQKGVTEAALKVALQEKDSLLTQKDFLLREVDHRIRNSLTLISSILQLQARSVTGEAREQFMEASRRVTTVAQVHQRLYQTGKLQTVEVGQYLGALLADISDSVAEGQQQLIVESVDADLAADDAVSLGLIVNELVTNAFKHGRRDDRPLNVKVQVERENGMLRIVVGDDGGKLPPNFDFRKATGLGMRLVSGLLQRLKAEMAVETDDGRTQFVISIPENLPVQADFPNGS